MSEKTYDTAFFTISLRVDGIVHVVRKNVPYGTLEDVSRGYDDLLATVDDNLLVSRISRIGAGSRNVRKFAWLYDVRSAPPARNDAAFERIHAENRPRMRDRSDVLCVICGSAAGVMQLSRMAREDGGWWFASMDEGEAVRRLRAALARDD